MRQHAGGVLADLLHTATSKVNFAVPLDLYIGHARDMSGLPRVMICIAPVCGVLDTWSKAPPKICLWMQRCAELYSDNCMDPPPILPLAHSKVIFLSKKAAVDS